MKYLMLEDILGVMFQNLGINNELWPGSYSDSYLTIIAAGANLSQIASFSAVQYPEELFKHAHHYVGELLQSDVVIVLSPRTLLHTFTCVVTSIGKERRPNSLIIKSTDKQKRELNSLKITQHEL